MFAITGRRKEDESKSRPYGMDNMFYSLYCRLQKYNEKVAYVNQTFVKDNENIIATVTNEVVRDELFQCFTSKVYTRPKRHTY